MILLDTSNEEMRAKFITFKLEMRGKGMAKNKRTIYNSSDLMTSHLQSCFAQRI